MNNNVGNHDQEKFRCINSPPSFNYTPYSYFSRLSDIYTNRDLKLHPYGVLRFKHYNMKILFIKSGIHPKNLNFILNCKKIELTTIVNHVNEIHNLNMSDYDVVYSPCEPIDVAKHPNTKFIFGPHFSVLPHQSHMNMIRNNNNVVYIQPSDWVVNLWKNNQFCNNINIKSFAFGVETERFCEILPLKHRSMVFVYFKSRNHKELNAIVNFLQSKNIEFRLFHYTARYSEEEYITCLQNSKYGIWLGCHESQGFALEEALSCNVPLLVWNVTSMNQEEETEINELKKKLDSALSVINKLDTKLEELKYLVL